MVRVTPLRARNHLLQILLDIERRFPQRESQTVRDAEDVRVYGNGRLFENDR